IDKSGWAGVVGKIEGGEKATEIINEGKPLTSTTGNEHSDEEPVARHDQVLAREERRARPRRSCATGRLRRGTNPGGGRCGRRCRRPGFPSPTGPPPRGGRRPRGGRPADRMAGDDGSGSEPRTYCQQTAVHCLLAASVLSR